MKPNFFAGGDFSGAPACREAESFIVGIRANVFYARGFDAEFFHHAHAKTVNREDRGFVEFRFGKAQRIARG